MISSIAVMLIGQLIPSSYTFVPYNTGIGFNLSNGGYGNGSYNFTPPAIAPPKIITISKPSEEVQGVVTAYDRENRLITLRCRDETVTIYFHPRTRWVNQGGPWEIRNEFTEVRYSAGVMTLILPRG